MLALLAAQCLIFTLQTTVPQLTATIARRHTHPRLNNNATTAICLIVILATSGTKRQRVYCRSDLESMAAALCS